MHGPMRHITLIYISPTNFYYTSSIDKTQITPDLARYKARICIHFRSMMMFDFHLQPLNILFTKPQASIALSADTIATHRQAPNSITVREFRNSEDEHPMPPKDLPSRRGSTPRSEAQPRRATSTTQLITFVDSQDPNSRSTIQRHTAHHSNAQRRDARMRSLRSNRPRLLEWQRRSSAETDSLSVTSPPSSTSSASLSPAPGLRPPLSAAGDTSTELTKSAAKSATAASTPNQSALEDQPAITDPVISDELIEDCK